MEDEVVNTLGIKSLDDEVFGDSKCTVVLLYHRIGLPRITSLVAGQYVAPALFRSQQASLIADGWQCVSLQQAAFGKNEDRNRFVLTFDDAYCSVYEHAYPALLKLGLTATIYVVAEQIGGCNQWDYRKGDCREPLMTLDQIREMADHGFEIGSHTLSHPRLTSLDDKQLNRELKDSKQRLEDMLGRAVPSLSYPYGDHDQRVIAAARAAGYTNAVTTVLGASQAGTGLFQIPRVNVRWSAIGPLLKRKIARAVRAGRP